MSIIIGDQNGSREAHIHDTPREPFAHHARLQFTDARCADAAENPGPGIVNTARLRYRVGSGGRIGVGLEQPRVFNPPGFNLLRLLAGWSSTPLVQFLQEPASGFAKCLKALSWLLAVHDQQRTNRSLSWVTRNKSRVAKCL